MKKLFGVTTSLTTPFDERDRVDVAAIEAMIDFSIAKGTDCLYPCGTTGEMHLMSCEERELVAETVVRRAAGRACFLVRRLDAVARLLRVGRGKNAVRQQADGEHDEHGSQEGADQLVAGRSRRRFACVIAFDIEGLQKEVDGISVDENVTEYGQWLKNLIGWLDCDISEERNVLQQLNREIGEIEKTLKTVKDAENELVAVKAQIKTLADEIAEWTILEKGLGNNGVIALTISDAGPAISATANELLNAYGGRFTVRIDTQDMKKDKKSLKETLNIMVFDSKTNKEANIKKKSGGQKAWILDAVAKAIGIYNKMANGIRCDTLYTDEVDGALDSKKKTEFFAMKREALKMGGYKKEFCISHTKELCDMADAVIKLGPEGVSITTN